MSDKHKLIKHGSIMMAATVIAGAFNYAYHIVMARMLGPGPDGYPVLFSLMALYMMITLPANTIQTVVSKYISSFKALEQKGKMSFLLHRFFKKLGSCFFIFLITYLLLSKFIAGFLHIDQLSPVVLTGLTLFFALLYPLNFGTLQGLQRFVGLGSSYVTGAISRVVLSFIFVYFGLGVSGALLGSLLSVLSVYFITFWLVKDVWAVRPYDKDIGKSDIYKYFVPVAVAYILFGIITYVDAIIVKHYFKDSFLPGYYSMVSMIGKAFLFLPMAFAGVMFPKVSHDYTLGKDTRVLLYKSILYGFLGCLLGMIVCISFPRLLIHMLLRSQDISAETYLIMIPLFRMIGLAVTPYGLICILVNYQLARHQYKFLPLFILGAVIQVTLLILFHTSLMQVLLMLFFAGMFILLFGTGAFGVFVEGKKRPNLL